jgi:hypothetical protein
MKMAKSDTSDFAGRGEEKESPYSLKLSNVDGWNSSSTVTSRDDRPWL